MAPALVRRTAGRRDLPQARDARGAAPDGRSEVIKMYNFIVATFSGGKAASFTACHNFY